jgi:hypothetical protein
MRGAEKVRMHRNMMLDGHHLMENRLHELHRAVWKIHSQLPCGRHNEEVRGVREVLEHAKEATIIQSRMKDHRLSTLPSLAGKVVVYLPR